jgi:hypothetical protein
MITTLATLDLTQLATVSGGFDPGRAIDAGNALAPKAAEAGGYLGAGVGAVTGFAVGAPFLGITAIPGAATGIAAGGAAGTAIGGAVGWGIGAGFDVVHQLKGH